MEYAAVRQLCCVSLPTFDGEVGAGLGQSHPTDMESTMKQPQTDTADISLLCVSGAWPTLTSKRWIGSRQAVKDRGSA